MAKRKENICQTDSKTGSKMGERACFILTLFESEWPQFTASAALVTARGRGHQRGCWVADFYLNTDDN